MENEYSPNIPIDMQPCILRLMQGGHSTEELPPFQSAVMLLPLLSPLCKFC